MSTHEAATKLDKAICGLSQDFHLTARFQVPANCLNLHFYFFEAGFSSRS
jgi:hypothetical protein